MRLTVRTLLAYLDGVLDAESSEVLAKKINESDFAGNLAARVRDSIGNPQIGSPAVGATHPIEDPNTVAEYLDNVLQAQHVPEVEKVLVDSDVHLSEAAACHQILTLVLSRPANVSPEVRDKMYRLCNQLSNDPTSASMAESISDSGVLPNPTASTGTATGVAQDAASGGVQNSAAASASTRPAKTNGYAGSKPKTHDSSSAVPDYLRSGRSARALPVLITLGLLAVLGYIVVQAFKNPLKNIAKGNTEVSAENPLEVSQDQAGPEGFGPVGEDPNMVVVAETQENSSDQDTQNVSPASSVATSIPPVKPEVSESESDAAAETETQNASSDTEATPSVTPAPVTTEPVDPVTPAPVPSEPEMSEPVAPATVEDPAPSDNGDPAPPENAQVVEMKAVGKNKQDESLLIAAGTEPGTWTRLKTDAPVISELAIINPPSFRNVLQLEGGFDLTLVDATELSFVATESAPEMRLASGKVLITSATPTTAFTIVVNQRRGTLTLADATSVASVQVTQFRAPSIDPLNGGTPVPVIAVQACAGGAVLQWEGEGEAALETGDRWHTIGEAAEISRTAGIPSWASEEPAKGIDIDTLARRGLLEQIVENKTVDVSLHEALTFRRAEVASLAARTLLMMGDCDPYFGGSGILNSAEQKSHWERHFEALQSTLARGPEHAQLLLDSMQEMNAAEAEVLYNTLVGYTDDQLAGGQDFELIEGLNSTSMPVRVLSCLALRQLTGENYIFQADKPAARRAGAVKKWESRRKKGGIRWTKKPTALDLVQTPPKT